MSSNSRRLNGRKSPPPEQGRFVLDDPDRVSYGPADDRDNRVPEESQPAATCGSSKHSLSHAPRPEEEQLPLFPSEVVPSAPEPEEPRVSVIKENPETGDPTLDEFIEQVARILARRRKQSA